MLPLAFKARLSVCEVCVDDSQKSVVPLDLLHYQSVEGKIPLNG